jgi:hypothetical protein
MCLKRSSALVRSFSCLAFTSFCLVAAEVETSYLYSAPTSSDPGNEIVQHEATARVMFDVVPFGSAGWGMSAGVASQLNAWDFDDAALPDVELYKLAASLKATAFPHPRFGVIITAEPGVHSDFENVTSEDLRLQGSLLGLWVADASLQVLAGLAYADDFGKAQIVPVVGVIWDATPSLHIEAVFPSLSATYSIVEGWRARSAVMAAGGEWNWTFGGPSGEVEIDASLKGYRAEVGVDRLVATDCWLTLKVGYEFGRELELERADGVGSVASLDLVDSAYTALSFSGKF